MEPEDPPRGQPDRRPIPDPTTLTTQQLQREVAALKEVLVTMITSVDSRLTVRIDGMDKAIMVHNEIVTKTPTEIDKQVSHLRELHDSKFEAINKQFENRDQRAEQANRDNKENVAAALSAAKEAVAAHNIAAATAIQKQETAFSKQIDQLTTLFNTGINAVESKVADNKDRLTLLEGKGAGVTVAQTKQEKDSSFWVSVVAVLVAFGGLITLVLINVNK